MNNIKPAAEQAVLLKIKNNFFFWDTKRRLLKALSCSDVVSLNIYMILMLLICLRGAPVFLTNDLHCSFI